MNFLLRAFFFTDQAHPPHPVSISYRIVSYFRVNMSANFVVVVVVDDITVEEVINRTQNVKQNVNRLNRVVECCQC